MKVKVRNDYGTDLLLCPVCGFERTHYSDCYDVAGYDDPAREYADNLIGRHGGGYRGDTHVLEFYCESGHTFSLRFSQHKGSTFVEAERGPAASAPAQANSNPDLDWSPGDP